MKRCNVLCRKTQRAASAFAPACISLRSCLRRPSQLPASDGSLKGLGISRLLPRLPLAILLGRNTCMQTEETAEVRLVLEAQRGRYLLDALAAVA